MMLRIAVEHGCRSTSGMDGRGSSSAVPPGLASEEGLVAPSPEEGDVDEPVKEVLAVTSPLPLTPSDEGGDFAERRGPAWVVRSKPPFGAGGRGGGIVVRNSIRPRDPLFNSMD